MCTETVPNLGDGACKKRAMNPAKADRTDTIDRMNQLILCNLLKRAACSENPAYRFARYFSTTYGQFWRNCAKL